MGDDQAAVEGRADAMSSEVSHHSVVEALRVTLDHPTDDTQGASRPDRSDSPHGRLVCALDE